MCLIVLLQCNEHVVRVSELVCARHFKQGVHSWHQLE